MIQTYDDLIARAGTEEKLAIFFKMHTFSIQRWARNGIPNKYWEELIRKYEVTPAELYTVNQNIRKARRAKANR